MKASSFEGSIVAVLSVNCHDHGVAHSLNVSTSLSFSREYAEAFMELCNSGTKGTEELGNTHSKRTEGVCTVNARIGLNWVMFQNI